MNGDHGLATRPVDLGDGVKAGDSDNGEAGPEGFGFTRGPVVPEQGAGEQAVPRPLADDPHRQAVAGVGRRVDILDEDVLAPEVVQHACLEAGEVRLVERPVAVAPPDVLPRRGLLDDELVPGGAAGVLARAHHQGPALGGPAFSPANDLLEQGRGGEVVIHRGRVGQADVGEIDHRSSVRPTG